MKRWFARHEGRNPWPRRIGLLAILLALLSLPALTYKAWSKARDRPGHASLSLSRVRCDFGRLLPGAEVEAVVTVENRGNAVLEIKPPTTTCGCQKPALARSTLPPGESTTLTLRQVAPKDSGPFLHIVFLECNDPARPKATLYVEGTVTKGVIVRPEPLELGAMEPDESRTRELEVRSDDGVPFAVTFCDGSGGVVAEAVIGKPALLHRIKVTAKAGRSFGFIEEHLSFTIDKPGSAPFIVPIRGEVRGPVDASPASLMLGHIESSSLITRKLVMKSRSVDFDVQSAKIEGMGWNVERFQRSGSPTARSRVLELVVRPPMQTGLTEARLSLDLRTSDGESLRIVVPITAVVTQPADGEGKAGGT